MLIARMVALISPLLWVAPALASDPSDTTNTRTRAALVEWTVANCGTAGVPAGLFSMSSMIINGSPLDEISPIREALKEGIAEKYADKEAACTDLLSRFKAMD